MPTKRQLRDLVKAAVILAITRHDLVLDPEVHDLDDGIDMDAIAKDVWRALNGLETCDGSPSMELAAILNPKA